MLKRPAEKILLGHDRGRKFAQGAEVNIGKPTGVGVYFTISFVLVSMAALGIAMRTASESVIFEPGVIFGLGLTFIAMITGLLDDRSAKPWNEYIKGGLDFLVSLLGALNCLVFFNSPFAIVTLGINGKPVVLNSVVFFILAAVLFVVSINATNATDGIDGLSGTLAVLTVITLAAIAYINANLTLSGFLIGVIFICVIIAYLIFNFFPSSMLMGDAGSRACGFFIAFYAIYLRIPFAYLIVGLPFLIDGGISILKITVGRLTRKKVILFKNIRTPLHEELKKNRGFSVPKVWRTLVISALAIDIIYIAVTVAVHFM
jgi:phospho-N-acetylmuramoyl-pentapeptide-transferase